MVASNHRPPVKEVVDVTLTDSLNNEPYIGIFNDLMVGMKVTDIQVQFTYNLADEMVADGSTGTGTATHSNARAVLSSGAGVGLGRVTSVDSVIYRAGHDVTSYFTVAFTTGEADTFQHIGPHDDENGFWVGYQEDVFGVNRIYNSGDNFVAQADFNLDILNGNGTSKFTLDQTKLNIFRITYGFLGIAPAIFSIYGGHEKGWIPFHAIDLTNSQLETNLLNPNLPIRADSERTSGTGAVVLYTASWHGGTVGEPVGRAGSRHFTAEQSITTSSTTYVPIMTIRNKAVYPTADPITNHIPATFEFLSCATDGTKSVEFGVFENATLGGTPASWSDVDAVNSVMEIDTSATTITGGKEVLPIILAKVDSKFIKIDKDDVVIRPGDIITVAVKMTRAGSTDADAAIHWNEVF